VRPAVEPEVPLPIKVTPGGGKPIAAGVAFARGAETKKSVVTTKRLSINRRSFNISILLQAPSDQGVVLGRQDSRIARGKEQPDHPVVTRDVGTLQLRNPDALEKS